MSGTEAAIVSELLAATDDQNWPRVLALVAEDSITRNSSGRIYVGHDGIAKWRRDVEVSTTARHFDTASIRELGDGFVLVVGAEHHDLARGLGEVTPGAWIYLVRDGLMKACMYFRTERDALASLSGPFRDEPTVAVIEKIMDAFNRDDFGAIVARITEDVRFVSSLVDAGVVKEGMREFLEYLGAMRARFDDVLVEDVEVEEIQDGWALTTCNRRVVDEADVMHQHVVFLIRVVQGRMTEWRPVPDERSGRAEAARLLASVEHKA